MKGEKIEHLTNRGFYTLDNGGLEEEGGLRRIGSEARDPVKKENIWEKSKAVAI